jgi:hypothetical protein
MPWPLTRTEIESFRRQGLSEVSIVDFIDHENRRPGPPLASLVHRRSCRSRKSSRFDLNLPYSRAVEMYMRGGVPTLDFGSRAEAARRITKPGRARRLTGGYPE